VTGRRPPMVPPLIRRPDLRECPHPDTIVIMRLDPHEPATQGWRRLDDVQLQEQLEALLPASGTRLILVDGRSGAGKTTAAERIAVALAAAVVHTDDIAWNHSVFDWDGLLLEHVIAPWRRGEPVAYRPPGWMRHGRSGTIDVPVVRTLVVEGVGACRPSLAAHADLTVWVQSDRVTAHDRGIERDVVIQGRTVQQAEDFWRRWMSAEDPFQAASRPWSRSRLIVRGTTLDPIDPYQLVVADGPLA